MTIDIEHLKQLKEKISKEADNVQDQAAIDRDYFVGMYDGLFRAANFLQDVIDKEEQEQKKQQKAFDMIKDALSGFCLNLKGIK